MSRELVPLAVGAGLPMAEVAELLRVSRETVRQILTDAEDRPHRVPTRTGV